MTFPEGMEPEEEAEIFLQTLFTPEDIVEFRAIRRRDEPSPQVWCQAPYRMKLVALQETNASGFNIYVGANPRSRFKGGEDRDVEIARSHCADFDDAGITLEHARRRVRGGGYPEPSIWVHSGRGLQCWWLLDEPLRDMQLWRRRQKEIARRLGTDPRIVNPSRVMRVPGYHNTKYPHRPIAVLMVVT